MSDGRRIGHDSYAAKGAAYDVANGESLLGGGERICEDVADLEQTDDGDRLQQ